MRLKRISSARGKRAVGVGTREARTGAEVEAATEWRISSTGAARAVEKRSVNSRIPARWTARLGFGMGYVADFDLPPVVALAWELRFSGSEGECPSPLGFTAGSKLGWPFATGDAGAGAAAA